MSLASLTADLAAFQAAAQAAEPYREASPLQIAALLAQGRQIIIDLDLAIIATGRPLDAQEPVGTPSELAATVVALTQAASAHSILHDMRGFLGRAVFNLEQGSA